MLAILSDLHLADGTTSTTVHPSAFEILRREIEAAARGNAAKSVQLLLLGDIFDLVRTDWWFDTANTPPEKRPWNGQIDPATGMNSDQAEVERQFSAILSRILDHPSTMGFIKVVQKLASSKVIPNLAVTYVIGNHDRALNNFPALQKAIQAALKVPVQFANSFIDPAYAVAARHGHEWDENCNARLLLKEVLQRGKKWDHLDPAINKIQALGEVITAELMSGLVWRVKQQGDNALTDLIKHVDLLRPATDVFQWIEWQARKHDLSDSQKQSLVQALRDSVSGVVDSDFGKLWDKVATDFIVSGDLVDRLQLVRSRLKASGYEGLRECVKVLVAFNNLASSVVTEKAEDFEGAKVEFERLGPGIQYLVYGHTHRARHDYLSGKPDGKVQMYINTGTYLPLLQTTKDGRGFAQSHQMTLTFFFNTNEDTNDRADAGPTVDIWNGIKRKQYR
jgi:UDP-2,3-diacylglucosamine pyrophosphatase LpxH